jgi:hypothetical protein
MDHDLLFKIERYLLKKGHIGEHLESLLGHNTDIQDIEKIANVSISVRDSLDDFKDALRQYAKLIMKKAMAEMGEPDGKLSEKYSSEMTDSLIIHVIATYKRSPEFLIAERKVISRMYKLAEAVTRFREK